mmetsp:Transcript_22863/g.50115  ORF Transcript_22863/g.50115 Transcript_22863/m.50115 type:complete len:153 (+) Transcript_22863:519-977(+)
MPNSSGGAVVTDTCMLAGMHQGILWHLKRPSSQGGSSTGGSTSGSAGGSAASGGSVGSSVPPPDIERDPNHMWEPPEGDGDVVEAAAGNNALAAELSRVNIPHKSSGSIFVRASTLTSFLIDLQLESAAPIDAAAVAYARSTRQKRRNTRQV